MKRFLALFLTFVMLFTMSTSLTFAGTQKVSATIMRIAAVNGSDVTVTNDKGKDSSAKADQKLLSGYTVKTGTASYCYISLDDSKAIKLDQNTKVAVEKSGKKIELNIKSGQIFFDVTEKLSGNESMNIKTSNIATGVRGTSGNVKVTNLGKTKNGEKQMTEINLLEGELEVRTASGSFVLNEGQKLTATGEQPNGIVSVTKADSGETEIIKLQMNDLEAFTIRATLEAANIEEGMKPEVAMKQPAEVLLENVINVESENLAELVSEDAAMVNLPQIIIAAAVENPSALQSEVQQLDAKVEAEEAAATAEAAKAEKELQAELASNQTAMTTAQTVQAQSGQAEEVDQVFETEAAATTGGGGGGGNVNPPQQALVTPYTGVYDGLSHDRVTAENSSDYFISYFETTASRDAFISYVETMKTNAKDATNAVPAQGAAIPTYETALSRELENLGVETNNAASYCAKDEFNRTTITMAEDPAVHECYYYAVSKQEGGKDLQGSFTPVIKQATIEVKWELVNKTTGDKESEVAQGTSFSSDGLASSFEVKPVAYFNGTRVTSQDSLHDVNYTETTSAAVGGIQHDITVTGLAHYSAKSGASFKLADSFVPTLTYYEYTFAMNPVTYQNPTFEYNSGTNKFDYTDNNGTPLSFTGDELANIISTLGDYKNVTVENETDSQARLGEIKIPDASSAKVTFKGKYGSNGSISVPKISFAGSASGRTVTVDNTKLVIESPVVVGSGGSFYTDGGDTILTVPSLTVNGGSFTINAGNLNISQGTIIVNAGSYFTGQGGTININSSQSDQPLFSGGGTVMFTNSPPTITRTGGPTGGAATTEACIAYVFGINESDITFVSEQKYSISSLSVNIKSAEYIPEANMTKVVTTF